MRVLETELPGVKIIEPRVFPDARGFFLETFHAERYARFGIPGQDAAFVQDNHSRSVHRVVRGLHFQRRNPQGKLVYVVRGRIWDVAVDIRPSSPTFRRWVAVELSENDHRQLWIPPGYAHGFCVLSELADVIYKTTALYDPADDAGIRWDDPDLAIDWPVQDPILSEKDRKLPRLAELAPDRLPA
ncbi:MAG: dTDP-4-dehydrorhamnose 3,5-epimerase [Zetaproteobacteria bacterium]|nr:MAG: dTDP-4-dehydrorhamnose 3,5-epimerase [Zetaproteobacteria bacterium]